MKPRSSVHSVKLRAGKHHDFCYVCGGTMELFGCQTCETSYHSTCMSPTLEPNDVPVFWWCPHCVDREWHIPPPQLTEDEAPPRRLYPSPGSINESVSSSSDATGISPKNTSTAQISRMRVESKTEHSTRLSNGPSITKTLIAPSEHPAQKSSINVERHTSQNPTQVIEHFSETRFRNLPSKRTQPSPVLPKKRSKYSTLSSDVDKALALIQKQLETAANNKKSEDDLRDRIKALEQQLTLKDGQIALANRELDLARKGPSAWKDEVDSLKQQNASLRTELEKKDAELRDWREKLKGLLGAKS